MEDRDILKRTDFWGNRQKLIYTNKELNKYCLRALFVEDESDVKIAQVILNYFIAVRKRWPNSWNEVKSNNILNKTTGFIALMKLFKDIYLSINKEIPSISDFYSMFENVSIEDGDFTRQNFPSGGSGENELYQVFRKSIFNT